MSSDALGERIREIQHPLRDVDDLDPLLERIGDARLVLLGEASHGTSEYYTWRHRVSERLIREKGFSFIAVEGDWPDCYRVNRYVKGWRDSGGSAREVLHTFDRWPTWMWANEEVVALAEWMREWNDGRPEESRVGFYGLDVYSLWDSMDAVQRYLERVDPEAARRARRSYACFDPYAGNEQEYAMATALVPTSCEQEAVSILMELRRRAPNYREDGREAYFNAEQNALVARNAEMYYRTMVRGGPTSWNVRDTHMVETLSRLLAHHGPEAKAIVWEHNTHIGDARATTMARSGLVNVGQLAREQWGDDVVLVGFSSHRGSVIAGEEWGAPMQRMPVPPAREGSWEAILHETGAEDRLIFTDGLEDAEGGTDPLGHRAIGVVYDPAAERFGNYVPTVMPLRYDALLYIDETRALRPLHMEEARREGELPETFPSGM
ncbi:MAG TPA: erythromycin esterase family protein [Longimicrobiaceae bacterium]|nr:erythromycin esterase family protein [Longimicrobiaceae bacterium]